MPDIGDFDEVSVIELLVAAGDSVKAEQSLITVESDKASMEIPSARAGVVKELKVKIGDKVKEGSLVLLLETAGGPDAEAPPVAQKPTVEPAELVEKPPTSTPPVAPAPAPLPTPAAAAGGGPVEVSVPDIGDFAEVAVIEVMVQPGDTVKVEQSLITVESDKASMEIPSSHAGVVKEVKVKVGDKVAMGSLVVVLEGAGGAAAPAPAAAWQPRPLRPPATATRVPRSIRRRPRRPTSRSRPRGCPRTSRRLSAPTCRMPRDHQETRPRARRAAREVAGSGPKGRITQDDVQGFVKGVMAGATQTKAQAAKAPAAPAPAAAAGGIPGLLAWPKVDFAKFGAVERKDLSRIKKISGANLHRNWVLIPHVTNNDDADITELEAFRVSTNKGKREVRREGDDARLRHQGRRRGAEEVSRVQHQPRRRHARLQAVFPHRLRRRHAQRPGRAGAARRRPEGRAADQRRDGRAREEGAGRQVGVLPT